MRKRMHHWQSLEIKCPGT